MDRLVLLFAAVVGAACSLSERRPASGVSTRDSAGIAISESRDPDRPTGWDWELVAEIGGPGSGVELAQANEYTVDADTLGSIYLLDAWYGQKIQRFDTLGALLGVLTRKGAGPGEIMEAVSISASPDGVVAAMDFSRPGLVRISADGRPLPVLSLPGYETFGAARAVGDTVVIHTASFAEKQRPEQLRYRGPRDSTTLVVHTPTRLGMLDFCGLGMPGLPPMLAPELRWTSRGSRVAVSHEPAYRVDLFAGGRLVRSVRRLIAEVPGNVAAVRAFFPDGKVIGDKSCVVPPDELVAKRGVAPVVQPIRRLAIDPAGRLWVERNTFPADTGRVDVFDSAGTYLGTMKGIGAPLGFPARGLSIVAPADSLMAGPRVRVVRLRGVPR